MIGRRRNSKRRARPRFEVVGELSGVLEFAPPFPVIDVSTRGALIESDRAWEIGSVQWVVIANGVDLGRAQICVRHVRRATLASPRFLVGVEFLSLTPALSEQIARWVADEGSGAATVESAE